VKLRSAEKVVKQSYERLAARQREYGGLPSCRLVLTRELAADTKAGRLWSGVVFSAASRKETGK